MTVTWSYYNGGLDFNGTIPIKDAKGTYNVPVFSAYHSFNFFGRSANVLCVPAVRGRQFHRRTQQPAAFGLSLRATRLWRTAVGQSCTVAAPCRRRTFASGSKRCCSARALRVVAPTGQYDPTKLINWGINRWAFKPEFGYSQRWGNWILDGYAGVWFYTTNQAFFSIPVAATANARRRLVASRVT